MLVASVLRTTTCACATLISPRIALVTMADRAKPDALGF